MDNPELAEIEEALRKEEEEGLEKAGNGILERIAANNGSYSETLELDPKGFIINLTDQEGGIKSFLAHLASLESPKTGAEAVYQVAYRVQEKFPQIAFTFERDPNAKSITYTVTKSPDK